MAGPSDQPPRSGALAVPDLIERYRVKRDAWIAQADELARLREEVRGSAEREAMEIVTAARRDVRKVIMEARRELLVLSAQVQAALGEATPKTDPATLLNKAGITTDTATRNAFFGATGSAFAPEDAVNDILTEIQDDMSALAEDARVLPLQAAPRQIAAPASPSTVPETISPPPMRVVPSIAPVSPTAPPSSIAAPASMPKSNTPPSSIASQPSASTQPPTTLQPPIEIPEITFPPPESKGDDLPSLSESASKVLLSSPFPSDAVPVPNDKRFRTFVALFVGVGATLAGVSLWWLSSGNSSSEAAATAASVPSEASAPAAARETSAPASAPGASTGAARSNSSSNLSVVAEAVRDVWIRTTIDGRSDEGRTLAAGQSIGISADQRITLRAGDAGAVMVSLNNGEKRPLGRDGQVVTREFVVERTDEPVRAPARRSVAPNSPAVPAPQPSPAAPRPSTPARMQPPVASATPAVAPRVVTPPPAPSPSTGNVTAANPAAPPVPTAPAPAPVPGAAVSQQTSNASQVAVPPGVVNQLGAAAAPLAAPAAVPTPVSPATVVVAVARQWLDAYHRQDRAAMAALSTENLLLADERRADERFPSGLNDVTRTLDRVSVQIAADTAVLTAVMMEQSTSAASPRVSPISQVWVLGGGQWKVRQARFVSDARLNSVFK